MFGVQPLIGRLPVAEDVDRVVLLSHGLWIDWFDGDPNVLGRSYSVAGQMRTVIGVMPPDFDFPVESVTLWFPNPIAVAVANGQTQIRVGNFGLPLVARVKPGVAPEALMAQLDLIASRLPEKYGGSPAYAEIIERFTPRVVPLQQQLLGSLAGPLWILLGATGILLLIACANVANLFLVRAEAARADVAIRRAIGAPLWNLVHGAHRDDIMRSWPGVAVGGGLAAAVMAAQIPVLRLSAALSPDDDRVPVRRHVVAALVQHRPRRADGGSR
jgi:hypothetical protein